MKKSDILISFIIILIFFLGILAIVYSGYNYLLDAKGLLKHCQDNGYDGIRYEEVNILREEPRCANFTIEEQYEMEKNKPFNEAAAKIFGSMTGEQK